MQLKALEKKHTIEQDTLAASAFAVFEKLISELRIREIPDKIANSINQDIEVINSFTGSNSDLIRELKTTQSRILKLIEKELKLVAKKHYQKMWFAIGMAVFGIPFGVTFGSLFKNMAFLAFGIPIGMVIGIMVGISLDKKAAQSGNQLDIEI